MFYLRLAIGAFLAFMAVKYDAIGWYVVGLLVGATESWLNAKKDKRGFAHKLMQQHCKAAESLIRATKKTEYEDDLYKITELENKGEESMLGVYVKDDDVWLAIGNAIVDKGHNLETLTFYYYCKPQFRSPSMLLAPHIELNKYA